MKLKDHPRAIALTASLLVIAVASAVPIWTVFYLDPESGSLLPPAHRRGSFWVMLAKLPFVHGAAIKEEGSDKALTLLRSWYSQDLLKASIILGLAVLAGATVSFGVKRSRSRLQSVDELPGKKSDSANTRPTIEGLQGQSQVRLDRDWRFLMSVFFVCLSILFLYLASIQPYHLAYKFSGDPRRAALACILLAAYLFLTRTTVRGGTENLPT